MAWLDMDMHLPRRSVYIVFVNHSAFVTTNRAQTVDRMAVCVTVYIESPRNVCLRVIYWLRRI